nr:helix-turn-helix domain-containing protein [Streptococcus sp. Marseille-Q5986]
MQGLNFSQIAKLLHRHPASISREWKRHLREESYSPREKCKLTKFLLKHYPPSK